MSATKRINSLISQIVFPTIEQTMKARIEFVNKRAAYIEFCQNLKRKGLKGSDYSDAVVKYCKENH